MKRVISACLEQTQKFETESDYQTYIKGLERKHIKYKIVDKQARSDSTVTVKIVRDYNDYPVGDYLD
jgi:dsRNA-specific ribonuclease